MDRFTRRIIGFGVHAGDVDGIALCRMLNTAISTQGSPHYLSSENDPLFRYHRWQANLRILEIQEIKTVPYVPLPHPFIERLIGTLRREFFWNAEHLERKLEGFRQYVQRASRAHFARRRHTIRNHWRNHQPLCRPQPIPVEISLPRVVPVTHSSLNNNSPYTGSSCGRSAPPAGSRADSQTLRCGIGFPSTARWSAR